MTKVSFACIAATICLSLFVQPMLLAGPVSLNSDEVLLLRKLVKEDSSAAEQFARVREAADRALKEKASPVTVVVSEGHLETDPEKVHTTAAMKDMNKIESLAWTWAATGDSRYSGKAREFILAWVAVNHPDGNPINETKFEPLIVAYDLLRSTFQESERTAADAWLKLKAETLWKSTKGRTGNWHSHRLKIVGLIGLVLKDDELWKLADKGYRKQIGENFMPDGSSTDFKKRDAMHYHLYTVEPLLSLAIAGERHGEALFNFKADNRASLKKAVDFVLPFAEGTMTHIEFVNSTVAFDRQRAENGEAEYQPHTWDPHASVEMFSRAAFFDSAYSKIVAKIYGKTSGKFLNWRMVVNAVTSKTR